VGGGPGAPLAESSLGVGAADVDAGGEGLTS
jgi:hypothetical protein